MDNLSINGNGNLNTPGIGQFWQNNWEIDNQRSEGQAPVVVPPPPPFVPTDISGLNLWLRSDLGITLSGSDVSAWADQSGNANHVSQSTGSRQPTFNATGAPNSLPSLDFVTADRNMLTSGAASFLSAVAGYTFYIVVKRPNTTNNTISVGFENAALTEQVAVDLAYCSVDSSTFPSATSTSTSWLIRKTIFDGPQATNALRLKLFDNTVAQTLDFGAFTIPGTTAVSTFFLIGDYYLDTPTWDFEGSIAEILIWPRALTGGEQAQVDTYLSNRYSIV